MEAHLAGIVQRALCSEQRCRQSEARAITADTRALAAENRAAVAVTRAVTAEARLERAERLLNHIESLAGGVYDLGHEIDQNGAIREEVGVVNASGQIPRISLGKTIGNHMADVIHAIWEVLEWRRVGRAGV